eukprot:c7355_g1_i1.p1 GENE.c7355_g1_i1~~c7355_g1_i1.p1  ORF type:complete len:299 (+),score=84.89 c7355_g1_i1:75-971(+)
MSTVKPVQPGSNESPSAGLLEKNDGASKCKKICTILTALSVIVIIVVIVLLAVYNPDVNKCGYASFPSNLSFVAQEINIRENVDIFALNEDGSKGSKVGELFKKLLSKNDIFRLLNQDGNLVASLTKVSSTRYSVRSCAAGPIYNIQREEYLRGECTSETRPAWYMKFRISSDDGVFVTELSVSNEVAQNTSTINFYSAEDSQYPLATIDSQGSNWNVRVSANSTFQANYIFNFVPLLLQKYTSLGFDCTTASASPSVSGTPSPSITPTPSVSHSSANQVVPFFIGLVFCVLSTFLLH